MASSPPFGAILGHFESFWALLGLFLTLFGHLGEGQRLQVGPDPIVGVKWGGESKLVGPEGLSAV